MSLWKGYRFDYSRDVVYSTDLLVYHTDLWEPQVALEQVEEWMHEIDTCGHQFDPSLRRLWDV